MTEQQKAAYHIGYLKALTELLERTKSTPILNREHLMQAMDAQIARMKNSG